MWVHISVFVITLFLFFTIKKGRIPFSFMEDKKNQKLFFIIALSGNLLGAYLTYQNGVSEQMEDSFYLIRKERESYTERFQAKIEGEEVSIDVRIPEKIPKEEEEISKEEKVPLKSRLSSEIVTINQEKNDVEKYYLPETLDGKKIIWERPGSTTGAFLTALCFVAAISVVWAQENEKKKKGEKRLEEMLLEYPNLVMKLTLLIQSGMTVRMAFHKMAKDYEKSKKNGVVKLAYEELVVMCYEMDSGISEGETYEKFACRCGPIKYKTLSTLLVQNLHRGSQSLLEMLEKESIEAFEDRKRKAKVMGESATTKLLVPMMLMLLVVLAIIMIPAILTFYGE